MQEQNAIEVRNVTKAFRVYLDRSNNIKDFIIHGNRRKFERRQVLRGISFDVKKGEAIGLIGHNGCGKSTTLKLLTRIIYPDEGTIEIRGRVSSLIELGAGFHPDMSGRENIYINASIFGLSKKEIDARINDMIKFSEMEEFIDNPVRTYSSGMYMRLAFAVAINVDADVLLIDEILAVGDIAFQKKCFRKLKEIKANGTTIVIVSHALSQIEEICDKTYWIDDGLIRMSGKPEDVHPEYLDYMDNRGTDPLKNTANDMRMSDANEQVWTRDGVMVDSVSCRDYDPQTEIDTHPGADFVKLTNLMTVTDLEMKDYKDKPLPIETASVCYGPYITLALGRYCLRYLLSGRNKSTLSFTLTITARSGNASLARIPLKVGMNEIEFTLQKDWEEVEFVVTNHTLSTVSLELISLAELD